MNISPPLELVLMFSGVMGLLFFQVFYSSRKSSLRMKVVTIITGIAVSACIISSLIMLYSKA